MILDPSFFVHTAHLLGMTVVVGGAAGAWYGFHALDRVRTSLLVGYEVSFWGAIGVLVVTGIGNLGRVGPPGPETRWGTILLLKLVIVLAFVLGSLPRTVAVLELRRRDDPSPPSFGRLYAATTATGILIVLLAGVLVRG